MPEQWYSMVVRLCGALVLCTLALGCVNPGAGRSPALDRPSSDPVAFAYRLVDAVRDGRESVLASLVMNRQQHDILTRAMGEPAVESDAKYKRHTADALSALVAVRRAGVAAGVRWGSAKIRYVAGNVRLYLKEDVITMDHVQIGLSDGEKWTELRINRSGILFGQQWVLCDGGIEMGEALEPMTLQDGRDALPPEDMRVTLPTKKSLLTFATPLFDGTGRMLRRDVVLRRERLDVFLRSRHSLVHEEMLDYVQNEYSVSKIWESIGKLRDFIGARTAAPPEGSISGDAPLTIAGQVELDLQSGVTTVWLSYEVREKGGPVLAVIHMACILVDGRWHCWRPVEITPTEASRPAAEPEAVQPNDKR